MEVVMIENNNGVNSVETTETVKYVKVTKVKRRRKNGRFNFVDAIIILMILVTVAAVVAYFLPGLTSFFSHRKEISIEYVIEITGVEGDFAANIKENDPVYDTSRNYEIGRVSSVETVSHKVLSYNEETGVAEYKDHPQLKKILVTVKGDAIYTAGEGYSINGQRIAVGKQFNVRFPKFKGSGYCIGIVDSSK